MNQAPDSRTNHGLSDEQRARLSALMDGEADAGDAAGLSRAWKESAEVRETWHAWQLAGDVLRSSDLASDAAHDAHFLQGLRARLAEEPVVLAPAEPLQQPRRRAAWLQWMGPAAVAAGFVAVATVFVGLRTQDAADGGGWAQALAGSRGKGAGSPLLASGLAASGVPGAGEARPVFIVIEAPTRHGEPWQPVRLQRDLNAHGVLLANGMVVQPGARVWQVQSASAAQH